MKWQFIKKYSGRVYEGTIHFRIAFKKKKRERESKRDTLKKNRTQRKLIIDKREENKEEFAKDKTWKFVGTSDSKCL